MTFKYLLPCKNYSTFRNNINNIINNKLYYDIIIEMIYYAICFNWFAYSKPIIQLSYSVLNDCDTIMRFLLHYLYSIPLDNEYVDEKNLPKIVNDILGELINVYGNEIIIDTDDCKYKMSLDKYYIPNYNAYYMYDINNFMHYIKTGQMPLMCLMPRLQELNIKNLKNLENLENKKFYSNNFPIVINDKKYTKKKLNQLYFKNLKKKKKKERRNRIKFIEDFFNLD